MGGNNQKSLWADHNIPALEYCSLARASRLLKCEVEDILHWAEIGAIELCLKFDGFRSALVPPIVNTGNDNIAPISPEDWIKLMAPHFAELEYLTVLSGFWFDGEHITDPESGRTQVKYFFEYENEHPALKRPIVYIYGVWAIIPAMMLDVVVGLHRSSTYQVDDSCFMVKPADDTRDIEDLITAVPLSEHRYTDGLRSMSKESLFSLTREDLFITRKQLEKIYAIAGGVMASFVNGGVEKYDLKQSISPYTPPVRTTAKQSDYIVGLLKGMGFTDSELAGSVPELRAKIATRCKEGLPDVDNNTLAEWLRRGGVSR